MPEPTNDLDAFRDEESDSRDTSADVRSLELLVFSLGEQRMAVRAKQVDSVVSWSEPEGVPLAPPEVRGVVQDRGRLVVVHAFDASHGRPERLVVCATSHGLVGLAATTTHAVGPVVLKGSAVDGTPVDTDLGALTILDPEVLAERMVRV